MKKGLLLVLLLLACLVGSAAGSDNGGGHGGAVHWGYLGDTGPAYWGDLSPEFHMCKDGNSQSPIDIVVADAVAQEQPKLQFNYEDTILEVVNNGHTIKANYGEGSKITVGGDSYSLVQFHFHSLSENKVNGRFYPAEAHLVHANAAGELAVVSVLFDMGAENSLLESLLCRCPSKVNSETTVISESINVSDLLPESSEYYGFTGSLTTPPCSEGVRWMVLKNPVTISPEQLTKFRSFFSDHDTNRPVQPLNGRVVYK